MILPRSFCRRRARGMVLATFTVSGAVALALEVVWLRSATIILGPTVYTVAGTAGDDPGRYRAWQLLHHAVSRSPSQAAACSRGAGGADRVRHFVLARDAHENTGDRRGAACIAESVAAALSGSGRRWRRARGASNILAHGACVSARAARVDPRDRRRRWPACLSAWSVLLAQCSPVWSAHLAPGFLLLPMMGSRSGIDALAAATLATSVGLVLLSTRSWIARPASR